MTAAADAPLWRNRRFRRVRFLQLLFWAVTLGFALAAPLAAGAEDAAALPILGTVCLAFALGIEAYRSLYVTALAARPEGLEVETLGVLGRRHVLVPWSEAVPGTERRDTVRGHGAANSWTTIPRPGRRIPFILDTTADPLDRAALRRAAPRR